MRTTNTSKTVTIVCALLLACTTGIAAQDFDAFLERFAENQEQIRTLVGRGSMEVHIANNGGEVLREIDTPIVIYMKEPSLFKLVVEEPTRSVTVQDGELMHQRMPGTNNVVTEEVTDGRDLFSQYLSLGIAEMANDARVLSAGTVEENGETLTRFRLDGAHASASADVPFPIDHTEMYFDADGMLVKTMLVSEGKPIATSRMSYTERNGVLVVQRLETHTQMQGMDVRNTIEYDALSVNTEVSDNEFELR